MKKSILLPVLMAAMAACNNNAPANQTDSTLQNTTSGTPAVIHITGTYQGTLPCADCPGMDYQVSLYDDHTFSELVA